LPLDPFPITLTPNAGGDWRHSILNRLRHKSLQASRAGPTLDGAARAVARSFPRGNQIFA
jgi:hypothetical protein